MPILDLLGFYLFPHPGSPTTLVHLLPWRGPSSLAGTHCHPPNPSLISAMHWHTFSEFRCVCHRRMPVRVPLQGYRYRLFHSASRWRAMPLRLLPSFRPWLAFIFRFIAAVWYMVQSSTLTSIIMTWVTTQLIAPSSWEHTYSWFDSESVDGAFLHLRAQLYALCCHLEEGISSWLDLRVLPFSTLSNQVPNNLKLTRLKVGREIWTADLLINRQTLYQCATTSFLGKVLL